MKKNALSWMLGFGILITICLAGSREASAQEILIIANNSVSDSSLSASDIKAIFLKKRTSFKSGDPANPINASKGTPLREAFLAKVMNMSKSEEERYWEEQKIKKGITQPAEIMNTLRATSQAGGISYVFKKDFKEGAAKILATF